MNAEQTSSSAPGPLRLEDLPLHSHGSGDTVEITGSRGSLAGMFGEAVLRLGVADESVELPGPDGQSWRVFAPDSFFATAKRQRTDAEREAWHDARAELQFSGFFSSARQNLCALIAAEVKDTSAQLLPPRFDRHRFRRERRRLAARLLVLSTLADSLLRDPRMTLKFARDTLAELGIDVPQPMVH